MSARTSLPGAGYRAQRISKNAIWRFFDNSLLRKTMHAKATHYFEPNHHPDDLSLRYDQGQYECRLGQQSPAPEPFLHRNPSCKGYR